MYSLFTIAAVRTPDNASLLEEEDRQCEETEESYVFVIMKEASASPSGNDSASQEIQVEAGDSTVETIVGMHCVVITAVL